MIITNNLQHNDSCIRKTETKTLHKGTFDLVCKGQEKKDVSAIDRLLAVKFTIESNCSV